MPQKLVGNFLQSALQVLLAVPPALYFTHAFNNIKKIHAVRFLLFYLTL